MNSEGEFELSGVNFSEILIKGKEIEFKLVWNSSCLSSSYRGSTVRTPLVYKHVGDMDSSKM